MSTLKETLFDMVYSRSFMYREEPFTLVSGAKSHYYFDCKGTTLDPLGVALVGQVMFELMKDIIVEKKIQAVGGLTLGADPITISTAIEAQRQGHPLAPLIVRKEIKQHGTGKGIEGILDGVERVIAFDDVITTGGSTIKAIERMRDAGLEVAAAAVLVDREEQNGRKNIEDLGVDVRAIFTRSDFDKKRLS